VVLIARASADVDSADHLAIALTGNATGEDHDLAVVGGVDPKELHSRLRVRGQVPGRDVEGPRCVGLLLRNVDAADIQAPSIRTWATRLPPSSAMAMFMGCPISAFSFSPPQSRAARLPVSLPTFFLQQDDFGHGMRVVDSDNTG